MATDGALRGHAVDGLAAAVSIGVLVAAWALFADLAQSRVLPAPQLVFAFLWAEAASGELWLHLGVTLLRVGVSFVLAMTVGSAIGIALGRSPLADRLFSSWVLLLLNLPALVVIVLAYVWFGLNESAAIGAVAVSKLPAVIVTLREGARAMDPALSEMARTFRFSQSRTLRHVVLPQLQPFFAAAARSGVALIWKIVLVVELLGRPNGIGFQIYTYFQFFDVRAILAYSLAFVAVMMFVELLVIQPLERSATRWRKSRA